MALVLDEFLPYVFVYVISIRNYLQYVFELAELPIVFHHPLILIVQLHFFEVTLCFPDYFCVRFHTFWYLTFLQFSLSLLVLKDLMYECLLL